MADVWATNPGLRSAKTGSSLLRNLIRSVWYYGRMTASNKILHLIYVGDFNHCWGLSWANQMGVVPRFRAVGVNLAGAETCLRSK